MLNWTKPRTVIAALGLPLVIAAAVIGFGVGCGGGGGGTTSVTYSGAQVFYGVAGNTTVPTLSPGDTITLGATGTVSGTGQTVTLTPYNFSVSAGAGVATVAANGTLTEVGGTVGATYMVTANSPAGNLAWSFIAGGPLTQPKVTGIVEADHASGGIAGVTVTAYDSSGGSVGSAVSGADGTFAISVPSTAVKFGISLAGVSQSSYTYYSLFSYGSANYDSSAPACLPPIPALNSGNHRYALTYPIQLLVHLGNGYTYPPPPPPGCLG